VRLRHTRRGKRKTQRVRELDEREPGLLPRAPVLLVTLYSLLYSLECVEGGFCELRRDGVLRSSLLSTGSLALNLVKQLLRFVINAVKFIVNSSPHGFLLSSVKDSYKEAGRRIGRRIGTYAVSQ